MMSTTHLERASRPTPKKWVYPLFIKWVSGPRMKLVNQTVSLVIFDQAVSLRAHFLKVGIPNQKELISE